LENARVFFYRPNRQPTDSAMENFVGRLFVEDIAPTTEAYGNSVGHKILRLFARVFKSI